MYDPEEARDEMGKWSAGGRERAKQKILVAHARVVGHEMKIKEIVDRMKAKASGTHPMRGMN